MLFIKQLEAARILEHDSAKKNLMPEETASSDEFSDPAIPRRVWEHLTAWSKSMGQAAQIIVVDNRPPHVADYWDLSSCS